MIVTDTNIIAYLFIPGVYTTDCERLLQSDSVWVVPLLWRSEFRNILAGYIGQKNMSLNTALELIEEAEKLLNENEYNVPSQKVMELVRASDCSAYDCEYVALADDLKVPLITTDKEVIRNFPKTAVHVKSYRV